MKVRIGLFVVVFVGFLQSGFGQALDSLYNLNSPMFPTAERIAYYEQLYRFRVTRFIDLNERQNAGFKSKKSNLAALILDLVKQGKLKPFGGPVGDPADFDNPMPDSLAFWLEPNVAKSSTQGVWNNTKDYLIGDLVLITEVDAKGVSEQMVYKAKRDNRAVNPTTGGNDWEFLYPLVSKLESGAVTSIELIEDVIFDKRKSRLTYDILAIGVNMLDVSGNGKLQPKFFVRYADLVETINKIGRSPRVSERASVIWQNRYNPSENKLYTDALKLRLFHGIIRKVENPDDESIMDIIYKKDSGGGLNDGRGTYAEGVFAMWEKEMWMMEKEHNLWEY